jgi:3-oxoacyl-[acyl-carrier protein] reductase
MKQIVVVTGCSKGLGLNITKRLLGLGYFVVGVARSSPEIMNPDFDFISCDFSDTEATTNTSVTITRKYPELFALINNAAIGLDGLLTTQHNSEISKIVQTNLVSPIILCKYLSRPMLTNSRGRIINISSIVANTGYRGLSVYAATKGGLVSFTRSLARDLGPANINVNCILPGFMESEMTKSLTGDKIEKIAERSAMKRLVDFDDVCSMVELLLSDSGDGISGSSIIIDAGNTA